MKTYKQFLIDMAQKPEQNPEESSEEVVSNPSLNSDDDVVKENTGFRDTDDYKDTTSDEDSTTDDILEVIKNELKVANNLFEIYSGAIIDGKKVDGLHVVLKDMANGSNKGKALASIDVSKKTSNPILSRQQYRYIVQINDFDVPDPKTAGYAPLDDGVTWRNLIAKNGAGWTEVQRYKKGDRGEFAYDIIDLMMNWHGKDTAKEFEGLKDGSITSSNDQIAVSYFKAGKHLTNEREYERVRKYVEQKMEPKNYIYKNEDITEEGLNKFFSELITVARKGLINHGFMNLLMLLDKSFKPNGIILPHQVIKRALGINIELSHKDPGTLKKILSRI